MNNKKYIRGVILCVSLFVLTGCIKDKDNSENTTPDTNQEEVKGEASTSKVNIMEHFNQLISEGAKLSEVSTFMKDNIAKVTPEEATKMILGLEELQTNQRAVIEQEKYLKEEIQSKFQQIDLEDMNKEDSIQDETIKNLVSEAKESGYKIETVEGYYFPAIDYSYYKQFSSYATPDMKEYIDIMAVESDQIFAKDAALIIGWDELVNRSISLEKYLKQYPESEKFEYIQKLYDNYVFITMNGLDNTPLFEYDTKEMNDDAKKAYAQAMAQSIDSEYLKNLTEFMLKVKNNGFKQIENK